VSFQPRDAVVYCVRRRFKLVKAKRRNYHYTIMTRSGYCY